MSYVDYESYEESMDRISNKVERSKEIRETYNTAQEYFNAHYVNAECGGKRVEEIENLALAHTVLGWKFGFTPEIDFLDKCCEYAGYEYFENFPEFECGDLIEFTEHDVDDDITFDRLSCAKQFIRKKYAEKVIEFNVDIKKAFKKINNFSKHYDVFEVWESLTNVYDAISDIFSQFPSDNNNYLSEMKKIDAYIKEQIDNNFDNINFTSGKNLHEINFKKLIKKNKLHEFGKLFINSFVEAVKNSDLDLVKVCKEYIKNN